MEISIGWHFSKNMKREDGYLELLWPQCSLTVDVDDTRARGRRGLLYKTKAADSSGFEKRLRNIGLTRLSASLTRHGADICSSNRE